MSAILFELARFYHIARPQKAVFVDGLYLTDIISTTKSMKVTKTGNA